MTDRTRVRRLLLGLRRYVLFLLLIGFVITCCMMLFLYTLQRSLGVTFTEAQLRPAATLTMVNIFLLSLLFLVLDSARRKRMVERPVRRIAEGAQRLTAGDFSTRIQPLHSADHADEFDTIIGYFNRMAEELSGLETLRTDFIANVSHELKTPLAVMQNYATMLQAPDLSDAQRLEYAKAISEQSRRLASLITNILKLNRLENQQIYPAKKRYNLGEQLAQCLLGFENVWEQKDIEIETDLEEEVFVETDDELLELVWNNLFSNALKFTDPGGLVSLTLKSDCGDAVVQVSDTGCGIAPETGRHIFEKFYQGDTSHATQGNGLGLTLVKRVVDIIGGKISVESEVGRGSTFTVTIRGLPDGEMQADS